MGVPRSAQRKDRQLVKITRVSPHVLAGARMIDGVRVVRLEVAVVQASAGRDPEAVLALLEQVLRARRTTVARLAGTTRRGLSGSAAVRAALKELRSGSLDREVRALHEALVARGVDGLRTEVRFVSASGARCYADLYDDIGQTVLEVDGFASHTERGRFRADRRRDRWMSADHGAQTFRIDAREIREDLNQVADEIAHLVLQRRAARGASRPPAG